MARPIGLPSSRNGITLEKEYGIDRAMEIREKLSKSHIGQKAHKGILKQKMGVN